MKREKMSVRVGIVEDTAAIRGNWQRMVTGAFPELGLDAESSFS